MLDISVLPLRPEADDWAFVFAGRNTLTSLRGQPGAPWRLAEADALWSLNRDLAVPLGYWGGKAAWAFSIPETNDTGLEALSGNLYSLLGRVDDSLFHAHGRAYQLLHWQDTHRYCGRCGSPLWSRRDVRPDHYRLKGGLFDALTPERIEHIFWADRLPWVEAMDDLPKHDAFPPDWRG